MAAAHFKAFGWLWLYNLATVGLWLPSNGDQRDFPVRCVKQAKRLPPSSGTAATTDATDATAATSFITSHRNWVTNSYDNRLLKKKKIILTCLLVSFDVWPCNWRFLEVTQWIIHTLFVSQFFAVARGLGRFQNLDLKGGFFGIFGLPLCFGCKTWGSLRDPIWDSFEDFQLGFLKAFGSWVNQPHLFKDPQSGPKSLILQGFFKVLRWMDPPPLGSLT